VGGERDASNPSVSLEAPVAEIVMYAFKYTDANSGVVRKGSANLSWTVLRPCQHRYLCSLYSATCHRESIHKYCSPSLRVIMIAS
jgi:hypothetical protein